jgi:hypothetical protein
VTVLDELDAALQRLKDRLADDVLPPDAGGLEELVRLVPNLPPDVHRLYTSIGGTRPSSRLWPHVMPPSEAASTVQAFRRLHDLDDAYARSIAPLGDGQNVLLLIYDDQSNYIGVHTIGAMVGQAFLLDHDEPDTTPKFKSLAAALDAMVDGIGDDELVDATYIGGRGQRD